MESRGRASMKAPTMARRHSTVTVGVAENIGIALDTE